MPPSEERAFASSRPSFQLNGSSRPDLEPLLTAMVVNLPLHGAAHAELHFTGWGIAEAAREPDFLLQEIALGDELEIRVGEERPETLFNGEITALEERYGEGSPTLVLLLQDRLHRLARSRHSRSFEEQSPEDLVRSIAQEAGLSSDLQLPSIQAEWHQLNESDLAFLMRIAASFDVGLRLASGRLRVRQEEADPNPLALDTQDSVLRARLIADLNHQPTAASVTGYNLNDDTATEYSAERLEPSADGTTAASVLNDLGWDGAERLPQPFARSSAEAEAYAKAHFRRQGRRFVSGDLVCRGEPSLSSGREIDLSGVSPRLQGIYQVVHCTHRFDNSAGYETHLKVTKGGWRP